MSHPPRLLDLAADYLTALEEGAVGDDLARFFDPQVEQRELPNRLSPHGATRDLAALLDGAEKGKTLLTAQRFEVVNGIESAGQVALEVIWTGTLALPVGSLFPGDEMRAHFAIFLEYRDGLIVRQRNYDCFEPW